MLVVGATTLTTMLILGDEIARGTVAVAVRMIDGG